MIIQILWAFAVTLPFVLIAKTVDFISTYKAVKPLGILWFRITHVLAIVIFIFVGVSSARDIGQAFLCFLSIAYLVLIIWLVPNENKTKMWGGIAAMLVFGIGILPYCFYSTRHNISGEWYYPSDYIMEIFWATLWTIGWGGYFVWRSSKKRNLI